MVFYHWNSYSKKHLFPICFPSLFSIHYNNFYPKYKYWLQLHDCVKNIYPGLGLVTLEFAISTYRIAGKFGGQNVWRIYYFQTFGKKKVWQMNRSAKGLSMVTINLDVFSWRIANDSPNLPNFPTIQ